MSGDGARNSERPRWRRLASIACLAFVFGWAGAARAADETPAPVAAPAPAPERAPALETTVDRVEAKWLHRKALVARGDRPGAAVAARELLELLHDEGFRRAPALAEAALREARREQGAGNASAAAEAFAFARALDPRQAAAYWADGWARLTSGPGRGAGLGLLAQGLAAHWSSFLSFYGDLVGLAIVLFVALLAAGAASVAVLFVAKAPILVHELQERLPREWHAAWRSSVSWSLVLAPIAVQWLGVFSLVLLGVAIVPGSGRSERRLIYTWLFVAAITPQVMGVLASLAGFATARPVRIAIAAADQALAPDLASGLRTLSEAHPREPVFTLLLARQLAAQRPDEAIHLLRDAVGAAPGDPRLLVALGDVFYRSGKKEAAAVHYRDALAVDGDNVLALFNLQRTRAGLLDFKEAESLLARAREIAPDLTRDLEEHTGEDSVADPPVTVGEVVRRMFAFEAAPGVRKALATGPASLVALAGLLAALALRIQVGAYATRRCTCCGAAFCERCGGTHGEPALCHPCHQLLSRKEGLAPAARQEQARRIDRRLGRVAGVRALVQALWPGLAVIHEGRAGMGFAQALTWAVLLVGAAAPGRLAPLSVDLGPWAPGAPWLAGAAIFWVIAQLPGMRPVLSTRRRGR